MRPRTSAAPLNGQNALLVKIYYRSKTIAYMNYFHKKPLRQKGRGAAKLLPQCEGLLATSKAALHRIRKNPEQTVAK